MLRIGLTGGMGAGKSTVARILAEHGAVIIDADAIAREVVAPGTEGLAALAAAFGPEILAEDGSLDRPALAARAFADDESRKTLNSITHPLVGKRTAELLDAAAPDAIVVQDIPLLVEGNMAPWMNLVLVVDVDAETRIRRLVEFRGVPEADARARISAQATDEQRRAVADVLLDNSGPDGALAPVVHQLWEQRLVPFEHNLRTGKAAPAPSDAPTTDPERPAEAQRLIARLRAACGAHAKSVDHIGDTAVPEIPAPAVLEFQITVTDPAAAREVGAALGGAGFPVRDDVPAPDPDDLLGAEAVHGNADPGRPATVYVRVDGAPAQTFALAARDLLRSDAEVRADYLAVRAEAAAKAASAEPEDAGRTAASVLRPWLEELARRLGA
ncbi:dephospho-CoA kinase [Nocardia bovistercoris]|uniref:Dephospho-CoA kinase n=1 Tax=Nocardia bovistercoris TaxID=2785916 RepID=A0A931IF24_9NOCA|nr:dephospho-CoA kinase [Nocardia bovistercoris]MBH0780254.1 dephospho-CoA kinase [Nocardia bovistercoris]